MKIQVVQREFNGNKSYKICDCKYCCEGIKHLPNVDFHYEITENTDNPIEDECEYGFDLGVMLEHDVTYHEPWDYDDYGYTQEYFYKLDYCPCCGEKIEVEIVDNVDVTQEYERLSKERDEIHKKCCRTDSKKKEAEYLKRRHELDRLIEAFYHTDTLPDREYEED